jgi:SprB repeat/CHU_C Type IX secretion signal domain
LVACTAAIQVLAQVPRNITVPPYHAPSTPLDLPETPCNSNAGTVGSITPIPGFTQSNDVDLDTTYLCFRDSVFINHNGNFNLSGDPNPATIPGIGYGFYTCPPTISGPTLQHIVGSIALPGDNCRLVGPPAPTNGIYIAAEPPFNGDIIFFNTGDLQNDFNGGDPYLLYFAPITFDDQSNNGYDIINPNPPGPCVNVSTAEAFPVVYLNAIEAVGVTNNFNGNNCLGRFRLDGGASEWYENVLNNFGPNSLYTLDLHLKSDPTIKALVYNDNAATSLNHFSNVVFSVPQPGIYTAVVEDGKSCGLTFDIDMNGCQIQNSVSLAPQGMDAEPGETVCIPIATTNFNDIVSFSFSLTWDPAALQLLPTGFIQGINGDLTGFDPNTNLNTSDAANGSLGISYAGGGTLNLNNTESLFSICFLAIAPVGQDTICTDINVSNTSSVVSVEDSNGELQAIDVLPGRVCIFFDTVDVEINVVSGCDNLLDLTLDISGNVAPYEILWQQLPGGAVNFDDNVPAGTFNINNLAPGDWQITVIPDNGAGVADQFDTIITLVANPLGVALNLTAFPTCNGLSNGTVSTNVFLGTTPVPNPSVGFTYAWSPVGGPNAPVWTGRPAGQYTVTVTQTSTGCTAVAAGVLGQPARVDNGLVTVTPASCSGVDDGSVVFNIQGGTPYFGGLYDIEVFYSTEPNDPTPNPFDNTRGEPYQNNTLVEGYYKLVYADSLGCADSTEVQITALRVVTVSTVSTTRPDCFNGTDGSIEVQVAIVPPTPGGDNFTFAWLPTGVVNSTNTNSTITGVGAGTYIVTAVNQAGCSDSLHVILDQPAEFRAFPIVVNNPTCPNPSGGSISVIGQGGTGLPNTHTYTWSSNVPGNTTNSASGLAAGTYSVTIRDANGCSSVFDTTLTLPPPPAIVSIDSSSVRCGGDGELSVVAPTAVSYLWSSPSGNILTNPTLPTITNLDGGVFVIQITDALNCTNTDTIFFDGVLPLAISDTTIINPSCFGYADGSIAVGVEGGNPGYNYAWSTQAPPNSPIILSKVAGTYTVTVTDSGGCTTTGTFSLVNPPQISVLFTGVAPASCFGECDGAATPLVQFLPGTNFNFQWQDGNTDSLRVDLCSGNNAVTITEAGGNSCFIDTTIFIPSPPPVTADTTETIITDVTCFGDSDGQIQLAAQGGNNAPYSFAWSAPAGATGSTISNLPVGTYQVTITDNNGCTGIYSANVGQPQPIVVTKDNALSTDPKCNGSDDGELAVNVTGGNAPQNPGDPQYTFSWSDGTSIVGNTNPLSDLGAGTYIITVTDSKQCTGTSSIVLTEPLPVTGQFTLGDPIKCFGEETTITINNIAGGNGAPYTYSIDFGVPLDPQFPSNIGGGPHKISYIDRFLCETIDSVTIAEPDPILVTFNEPDGINDGFFEIQLGDSAVLSPLITGAADFDFVWTPGSFFIDSTVIQPTLYTFQSGKVTLFITDDNGCTGMGMIQIEVDANRNVYLPNIFVPGNNEGTNDYFAPGVGLGVENINFFRVFDRWGGLIYSRDNISPEVYQNSLTEGWDGRYKGRFVDPGVYVYAIEVKFLDGKKILYRGDITVAR